MSTDFVYVAVAALLVILGLKLSRAWLRDFSGLLWLLSIRPALTAASVGVSAAVVIGATLGFLPDAGYPATRVLVVLVAAPLIARPLTDALAWAVAPASLRSPARPVLVAWAVDGALLAILTFLLLILSTWVWPGPPWSLARLILAVSLALSVVGLVARAAAPILKRAGERRSTRDFVFDQVAHEQQAAFVASLAVYEDGPLSDAGEMFGDVPAENVEVAEPAPPPAAAAPRAGRRRTPPSQDPGPADEG